MTIAQDNKLRQLKMRQIYDKNLMTHKNHEFHIIRIFPRTARTVRTELLPPTTRRDNPVFTTSTEPTSLYAKPNY